MEVSMVLLVVIGLLVLLLFYIAFKITVRVEKVEQSLTTLVRELALRKK